MRFVLLILGCIFSVSAAAGIYKCTDKEGNTKYLSKPCAEGDTNIEINIKTGIATDLNEKESQENQLKQHEQAKVEKALLDKREAQQKQERLISEAKQESAKNQFLIKSNPEQYSAYAIPPYDPGQLPALVKTYQDRLPEIERLRRQASQKALQSGQCTRVESSELNEKSSGKALVFLIDCSSGKHFYFSEQELAKS